MELIVNDLSLNGQFPDLPTFKESFRQINQMRQVARQYGRELRCHRNLVIAKVTQSHNIQQAIQSFDRNLQQAIMQWLTQYGPFWEDERLHSPDDWLEHKGDLVTDSALGEAAYCCCNGSDRHLVSFVPSAWEFAPIPVLWLCANEEPQQVQVPNYWQLDQLDIALNQAPTPFKTWQQMADACITRCPNLRFTPECFEPLQGVPFHPGVADSIRIRLELLEKLKGCVDENGKRTPDGLRILQNHFTDTKHWFSDSSDTEKREFKNELTFHDPDNKGKYLFCTWHGKVKTPQIRIHISSPFDADKPFYIAYIGPKITKQ